MRRRARPDLALSLAAIAAVTILLALALFSAPPLTALADATEGAHVTVEARIVDLKRNWTMLSDGARRLPAILPRGAHVERADLVRGSGIVSRDDAGLLLSLDDLVVTVPNANVIREPLDLAAAPRDFEGATVAVAGRVAKTDLVGGGARIAISGNATPVGDVIATGVFRYHEGDASYHLWVDSWTPRS